MELHEVTYGEAMPIESYGAGFFRINGVKLQGPSLITPWSAGAWGGLTDAGSILAFAGRIDVLLLGMGNEIAYPPAALREALQEAGIGLEPMSTPSACRTYNVLLSEGRRIAAAVLPIV